MIALVAFSFSRTIRTPASPEAVDPGLQSSAPLPVPETSSGSQGGTAPLSLPPAVSPRDEVAPPIPPATPMADAAPTQAQLESVPRIEPADLREKLENRQVTVIDVRDVDSYRTRHIPGAMQIPLSYIAGEVPYLPKDKPIVTYCT